MKLVDKTSTLRLMVATAAVSGLLTLGAVAQDAGFGNDIPLGAAVQRIVPQGNTVRLESGVDRNVRVSWNGSDGWRRAVEQATADAGYTVVFRGTEVVISAPAAPEPEETVVANQAAPAAPAAPVAEAPKPASPSKAETPAVPRPQVASAPSRPNAAPRPQPQPSRPAVQQMPVVSGGGFVLIPGGAAPETQADRDGWKDYGTERPTAAPVPTVPTWEVAAGDDLNVVLTEWAAREGWRVQWESEYVYTLRSPARFRGDFVSATTELLRGMQDARPVVTAEFFQGNKVLVVGNNNLDEVN